MNVVYFNIIESIISLDSSFYFIAFGAVVAGIGSYFQATEKNSEKRKADEQHDIVIIKNRQLGEDLQKAHKDLAERSMEGERKLTEVLMSVTGIDGKPRLLVSGGFHMACDRYYLRFELDNPTQYIVRNVDVTLANDHFSTEMSPEDRVKMAQADMISYLTMMEKTKFLHSLMPFSKPRELFFYTINNELIDSKWDVEFLVNWDQGFYSCTANVFINKEIRTKATIKLTYNIDGKEMTEEEFLAYRRTP